jgi:NAD(P)H dehydrogenase (quinone)
MVARMKISIIYYSATGQVAEIAREMVTVAEKAGAEVRLRRVDELAPRSAIDANPRWAATVAGTADVAVATADDILWADAVLMGTPARFGNIAGELKRFLDTLGGVWQQGLLADKVYSGFTSAGTLHGGHESALLALTNSFHHFGGVVVAPGYTHAGKMVDGNPYGTSHFDAGGTAPVDEVTRTAARIQVERVVRFARAVAS